MKRTIVATVLIGLMLTGCAGAAGPTPQPAATQLPTPAALDLTKIAGSSQYTPEELASGLERLMNDPDRTDAPLARLTAVINGWKYKYQGTPCFEADLDGDGQPELVAGLATRGRREQSGAIFIISRRDGHFHVEWNQNPDTLTARVITVADMAGTGRPQVVWANDDHGAHTSYAEVFVTGWEPGTFTTLAGPINISFAELKVEGRDLVLHGGTAGSAGAGIIQRQRTDRLRWVGGKFQVVDRVYDPSPLAYHRLLDGMTAETYGHPITAENAYHEAMEPDRQVLAPNTLLKPEQEQPLRDAVRELARFRLGAFLLAQGRQAEVRPLVSQAAGPFAGLPAVLLSTADRTVACNAARGWATEHPEFVAALNAPPGYKTPRFSEATLCGPVPPSEVPD